MTMIPGDGIGPELMLHVKSVFRYGVHGGGGALSPVWRGGQRAGGGGRGRGRRGRGGGRGPGGGGGWGVRGGGRGGGGGPEHSVARGTASQWWQGRGAGPLVLVPAILPGGPEHGDVAPGPPRALRHGRASPPVGAEPGQGGQQQSGLCTRRSRRASWRKARASCPDPALPQACVCACGLRRGACELQRRRGGHPECHHGHPSEPCGSKG